MERRGHDDLWVLRLFSLHIDLVKWSWAVVYSASFGGHRVVESIYPFGRLHQEAQQGKQNQCHKKNIKKAFNYNNRTVLVKLSLHCASCLKHGFSRII